MNVFLERARAEHSCFIDVESPRSRPGAGRPSTLEAVALCRSAAGDAPGGAALLAGLAPLVALCRAPAPPPAVEAGAWVDALAAAAAAAPPPPRGLRRCDVCATTQAAPHRMRAHVAGRRHCATVAARLRAADPETFARGPGGDGAAAARALAAHSAAVLAATVPEPADLALADLADALPPPPPKPPR